MANKDFIVRNGIVVNTAITANSTGLYVGVTSTNVVITPANSTISFGSVSINSISYNGTSNNTTYVNSKTEGNLNVNSATYATSAGSATNASAATNATSAGSATNATYATSAGSATNASAATNATYATSAGSATNASVASTFTSTSQNSQFNSIGVGTAATGTAGEIRATSDVTAYYSSDISLKEKITKIENPLEKLFKINGYKYDWKDDYINSRGGEDGYFIRKHDVGVIAQEIEQVLPEIVSEREDGIKAVKYERIVALLIEAVKELSEKVDILENRVK